MNNSYIFNEYISKPIKDKILVTTDHGDFIFLTKEEFGELNREKPSKKLAKKLIVKGLIVTEESKQNIIGKYKKRFGHLFQGTSLHIVVPTLRCNMKCTYCHSKSKPADAKGYDMDKKTAKRTVDFIFQSPAYHISIEFQGGEPLLNFPVVKYIVDYAKKLNKKYKKDLRVGIVTNCILMDKKKFKYFVDNKVGLCISLDGPEKLHDKNRCLLSGGGTYKVVSKWLKYYKENAPFRMNSLMVTTKYSLSEYKEIIDEYLKKGFDHIQLKLMNDLGFAHQEWREIGYDSEDFIKFWKKAMDYILKINKKGVFFYDVLARYMLMKIVLNKNPNYVDLNSPCGAAIGQLAYNYNGDIYTCDEGKQFELFKLGNVRNNTYKEILCSDNTCGIIASSINDTQFCDSCVYKPYCGICPVLNYSTQNNIICKFPLDYRCRVLKAQFGYIFEKLLNKEFQSIFKSWVNFNDTPFKEE